MRTRIYVNGNPAWSEWEEAGHANPTRRGGTALGGRTAGSFIATYKVGAAPEVRHEAALKAAETVRRRYRPGRVGR